ncbi:MAG: trypsin-like peptidase domain-containing protein [Acidimicrobiales bacterium]
MEQSEVGEAAPAEEGASGHAATGASVAGSSAAVPLGPVSDGDTGGDVAVAPARERSDVAPAAASAFLPPLWQSPPLADRSGTTEEPPPATGSDEPWRAAPTLTAPTTAAVPVWAPVSSSSASADDAGPNAGRRRGPGWPWAVVSLVAALFGALVGGGIVAAHDHSGDPTTVKEISAGPALLNGTTDIQAVIDKVLPAVVSIDAKSSPSTQPSLFGGGAQEDQGTGMIITPGGEVVTNNHVIAGATTITVTLWGKTTSMPATLIDTDPSNDVALLQITGASDLPTVSYGNSDDVQVGDAVVAIGNALGLSAGTPTVTQGIISASGRTVQASDSSGNTTETLTNMFQTDAAINPGNSGGPLVDSSGKVIAMNTAVASSVDGTSQAQNIGFAIPSNKIQQLLPALRSRSINSQAASGTAFLGVSLETLTPELRSQYNFVPTQGAVVLLVESGSPADLAGLQQGDVITTFDGKPVTSADQLAAAIQGDRPGRNVTIGLYRGSEQLTVTATLGSTANDGG